MVGIMLQRIIFLGLVEKIGGKGENAGYQWQILRLV